MAIDDTYDCVVMRSVEKRGGRMFGFFFLVALSSEPPGFDYPRKTLIDTQVARGLPKSGATVTATQSNIGTYHQSLTVVALTGAADVGASAHANGATGAPTVSLTSSRAGSLVFGAGNDWDAATARTVGAGQAMLHEYPDTVNGDDLWAQNVTAPTGVAGSTITVGDTAPTADRWNLVAVEVVPAASTPVAPETTRYAFTGAGDSPDFTLNTSNTVQERTLALPGGVVLSIQACKQVWSYPNLHGHVIITTNGAGVRQGGVTAYDPFGQPIDPVTGNIGSTTADDATPGNTTTGGANYGWVGSHQKLYEHAGDVATIEMGARQYVTDLGRFLEIDPIADGNVNDYVYPNDPINQSDLNGQSCKKVRGGWCGSAANRAFYKFIKIVAFGVYATYFIPNRIGAAVNRFACRHGRLACGALHIALLPLVPLQIRGLIGDMILDRVKNKFTEATESMWDENSVQPMLGTGSNSRKIFLPGASLVHGRPYFNISW